jgi:hypothetical protein
MLAVGFAILLYTVSHPWTRIWNRILFVGRAVLAFLLMFLLLGPIVKQINNLFEKPLFLLVYDNSASIKESNDSVKIADLEVKMKETAELLESRGYQVKTSDLSGVEVERPTFDGSMSDLGGALRKISNRYESSQVGGVVLASDGIYNEGVSPLYASYNYPIYTIGIGDTVQRTDVFIRDVYHNKIVYQGNKFPLQVAVLVKNLPDQSINVSIMKRGKQIEQQSKVSEGEQLLVFDFHPLADEQGMQKLDIKVDTKAGEFNTSNNQASVFIEVVEGKKKILLIAGFPHPDIKALREVVNKNPNYEFLLHMPGVDEQPADKINPENIDLAIFHQAPDTRGKTRAIFEQYVRSKTSVFFVIGMQTDIALLSKQNMPVIFESTPREYDEVLAGINPAFSQFTVSAETNDIVQNYPPVSIPFGKMKLPGSVMPILFQRIGNLTTQKPLLYINVNEERKTAVMLGEGLWRWKLNEFDRFENSTAFDEVFGKLIQYLSTSEDKRKFKSYPVKNEFADTEPVVFESQVYNDIFEPVFGNTVDISLTDDGGKVTRYSYTMSPGNSRYQIGGLKEGVYRYEAKTALNGKDESVRGEFAVVQRKAELQNLTADFDLLRKLSVNSGGVFYPVSKFESLKQELQKATPKSIIHTEESYKAMINLKGVFWLLLLMVSLEWFARKYFGSY